MQTEPTVVHHHFRTTDQRDITRQRYYLIYCRCLARDQIIFLPSVGIKCSPSARCSISTQNQLYYGLAISVRKNNEINRSKTRNLSNIAYFVNNMNIVHVYQMVNEEMYLNSRNRDNCLTKTNYSFILLLRTIL